MIYLQRHVVTREKSDDFRSLRIDSVAKRVCYSVPKLDIKSSRSGPSVETYLRLSRRRL